MNIIDHRILVPKSPELIWEHISSLDKNPTWQVDCSNISVLTTRREGAGVRWRSTSPKGREYVGEITAWYDGLGYEYTFVDGVSYRENKGRIRLQEIPEGTVVQWTFTYEIGGVLGSVRNAIVSKRQLENAMVDSLKTLWRIMNQTTEERDREAKSLVRDAPDYETRAQYKPRHPSVVAEEKPAVASAIPLIPEPEISDEDTRPHPPVEMDVPDVEIEPAVLSNMQPDEVDDSDISLPSSEDESPSEDVLAGESEAVPVSLDEERRVSVEYEVSPEIVTSSDVLSEPTIIQETNSERPSPEIPQQEVGESSAEATIIPESIEAIAESEPVLQEQSTVVDQGKLDTKEVSVFDLFGLPKPSETQEMRAVSLVEAEVEPEPVQSINMMPLRTGLRLKLRRKRVKLRWPVSK